MRMNTRSTREEIVDAADQLFYRQGFEHTSFAHIADAMEALQARVNADPFVAEGIVIPGTEEILPNRADERLGLLAEERG